MKKLLSLLLCCALLFACLQTTVAAQENTDSGITPYLNNTLITNSDFAINDSTGIAHITVSYTGYEGITTGATITTKLEKRFLLFFWQDVEIGTPDNVWVDEVVGVDYINTYSLAVESGTYRATITYEIRGTGGADDVLVDELQQSY